MSATALTILYWEQNFNFAICLTLSHSLFHLISFEGIPLLRFGRIDHVEGAGKELIIALYATSAVFGGLE